MKTLKMLIPVLLGFALLSLANGQPLPKGAVVANWNFTLKPEVQPERFEKFVKEEYIPAFEKNFEGVKITLLSGERGVKKGGYCILLHFKSKEVRNQWWPSDGIASDMTKEATSNMKAQDDRLNMMIDWESFTDWIVL
jgi:hypothetical protein